MFATDEDWLIKQYTPLVHKFVNRFKNLANVAISEEDLTQIAFMGLLKANRNFDPDKGFRFLTFAYPVIQGEIVRQFRNVDPSGKYISRSTRNAFFALNRATDTTEDNLLEIKNELGICDNAWREALELFRFRDYSMDAPVPESVVSNGVLDAHEFIGSDAHHQYESIELQQFLDGLSERDRKIVIMYSEGFRQDQIGKEVGISQVQVSRILRKVQNKGREWLQA